MISFLFETRGFTNNPNFILFKWRLKRKHSPAKCVIRATEIRRMEIHLKRTFFTTIEIILSMNVTVLGL